MGRVLLICCFALLSVACNDAGTNPFLVGDMSGPAPDTGAPDAGVNSGVCLGCLADGECVDGDEQSRCGAGGAVCDDCGSDRVCSEGGECIDDPTCGPGECGGCCDGTGGCQSGDDDTFCGSGGLACTACPDGSSCIDGTCQRPCGPDTCAGCCDGQGECVGGSTDALCGTGGVACTDCAAGGEACSMGTCVSTACADTCAGCCDGSTCVEPPTDGQCGATGNACVDCGAGRTCGAAGCELDTTSTWSVRLVSGEVGATNAGGGSWDGFNGLPDPYVVFVIVNQNDRTSATIDNTLTPSWDETLGGPVPAMDLLAGVTIQLRDSDAAFDDEICDITVALTADDLAFSGALIESPCPDAALGKVTWRLQAQ